MLLPQSAAFAALKNRLNSVSAIGYLHMPTPSQPRPSVAAVGSTTNTPATTPVASNFDRAVGRLKPKDEGPVKWSELLDRFKATQERGKRSLKKGSLGDDEPLVAPSQAAWQSSQKGQEPGAHGVTEQRRLLGPTSIDPMSRSKTTPVSGGDTSGARPGAAGSGGPRGVSPNKGATHGEKEKKSRFSAARFGKLTGGVKSSQKKQ